MVISFVKLHFWILRVEGLSCVNLRELSTEDLIWPGLRLLSGGSLVSERLIYLLIVIINILQ